MWPEDADGDVFRRLEANGLDFAKEYNVDFNVDFQNWPPPAEALKELRAKYENVKVVEPETVGGKEYRGYVVFNVRSVVTYELVTSVQTQLTKLMKQYGGCCDSWGVLHG